MATGSTNAGGSGGLNFKLKTYSTEVALLADSPRENTIGIVTDTAVSSYTFAASAPATPAAGDIWIKTGSASPVEFNALKRDGIMVYPLACQQYNGSNWLTKPAKVYMDGAWADFATMLYDHGTFGGGATTATSWVGGTTFTLNDDNIYYYYARGTSNWGYRCWGFSPTIDLTEFTTLTFKVAVTTQSGSARLKVGTFAEIPTDSSERTFTASATGELTLNTEQTLTVDISSLVGSQYVGIEIGAGSSASIGVNTYEVTLS